MRAHRCSVGTGCSCLRALDSRVGCLGTFVLRLCVLCPRILFRGIMILAVAFRIVTLPTGCLGFVVCVIIGMIHIHIFIIRALRLSDTILCVLSLHIGGTTLRLLSMSVMMMVLGRTRLGCVILIFLKELASVVMIFANFLHSAREDLGHNLSMFLLT